MLDPSTRPPSSRSRAKMSMETTTKIKTGERHKLMFFEVGFPIDDVHKNKI
jgi:hypothetical protein